MDLRDYKIELCSETTTQILELRKKYDQVEFCSRLDLDGLSPSLDDVHILQDQGIGGLKVMVRNRPGDFTYSRRELAEMRDSIFRFREAGVERFVFGALKSGRLDVDAIYFMSEGLVPFSLCVHKAIDDSLSILEDLKLLNQLPAVGEVLTSGGAQTAAQGAEMLREMITIAGQDIKIIAAGKVTSNNIDELHRLIGAEIYHGRKIIAD